MGKGYRHYDDCECGWCGGPRVNRTIEEQTVIDRYLFDRNNYESFLRPNAICPVCGDRVFFFQAKNGGRVFFDEVGPPWPKHPCTNNSDYSGFGKFHYTPTIQYSETIKAKWLEEGWQPFAVTDAYINDFEWCLPHCHVTGYILPQPQVKVDLYGYNNKITEYYEDMIFIREEKGFYMLAAISIGDNYPKCWKVYRSYEDLVTRRQSIS